MKTIILSVAIGVSTLGAQSAPPPRYSVGAAYDTHLGALVIFGGMGRGYSAETWQWNGTAWTLAQTPGPSARNGPQMVHDSRRQRIVMFGGDTRTEGALADTWERRGQEWTRIATSGPARSTAPMVFDSRRGRVVMFGGAGTNNAVLGDTWEWDGTTWTQVPGAGPPARALHGMAYDSARGRTVAFGGTGVLAPDAVPFGDTWEYDGVAWKQVPVSGPSARDHTVMAYDPVRRAVVLHGGGQDAQTAETWAFDGASWTRISTDGPRRRFATLTWDPRGQQLILYGGYDRQPSNEIWSLSGSTWRRLGQ